MLMSTLSRAVVRILVSVLAAAGFAQVTPDKPAAGVHISGRVVDAKGRPLGHLLLHLAPLDPSDTTAPILVQTRYDGLVSLSGVLPKKYRFVNPYSAFEIIPAAVDVGAKDDVEVGDIIIQPDVTTDLRLEQIIVDSLLIEKASPSSHGLGAIPFPLANGHEAADRQPGSNSSDCNPFLGLGRYQTVEAFVGGKVKAIRVVRFSGPSETKPAEIQSRVMEVWSGVFTYPSCYQAWSELTIWNLEASIEYEDGKRSLIVMDGSVHVAVQDRTGRFWFMRLWPSA
jgi:hypothetical protein